MGNDDGPTLMSTMEGYERLTFTIDDDVSPSLDPLHITS